MESNEHERLERLQEIAQAVAETGGYVDEWGASCLFPVCRAQHGYGYPPLEDAQNEDLTSRDLIKHILHAPNCPVVQARAWLLELLETPPASLKQLGE